MTEILLAAPPSLRARLQDAGARLGLPLVRRAEQPKRHASPYHELKHEAKSAADRVIAAHRNGADPEHIAELKGHSERLWGALQVAADSKRRR
jgi:hypothetical protein